MKKTTLFLLSSVSVLIGCYSSPEMNENRYEEMYQNSTATCRQPEESYQHKGLRSCLETRIAWDNAHKKTVTIIPNDRGLPLVLPKTYDSEKMLEENRVYEVIDSNSNAVFVNDSADFVADETTEVAASETVTINEVVELAPVPTQENTAHCTEEEECVIEEEIVEECAEDVCDNVEEEFIEQTTEITSVDSCDVADSSGCSKGVTLVMGPLKEELIISVKSAKVQEKEQVQEAQKTVEPVKKVTTSKKIEKEVLPLEEK